MPQQKDVVAEKLAGAKAALAHANSISIPRTSGNQPAPSAKPAPIPAKPSGIGAELAAKKTMVDKAISALPRMHKGGPVTRDGVYQLKAGEHVLTAKEADRTKKHALMASGLRSMAVMPKTKPSASGNEPTKADSKGKAAKPASKIVVGPAKKSVAPMKKK